MKGKVLSLTLVVVLVLLLVAPASAANPGPIEQRPLKTITIRVRMLACTNLAAKTGCYPLHNAYWQWNHQGNTNPNWLEGGTLMGGTDSNGWGSEQFFPDYRWTGLVYCKGYNWPDGSPNITQVMVTGTTSKTVTCPTLYSQG